jgi:hypothetical protein
MRSLLLHVIAGISLIVALGFLYGALGTATSESYTRWSDPEPLKATAWAIAFGLFSLIAFSAAMRSKRR